MKISILESLSVIKALSDSSRLLIISALKERPQYVEEIAERLHLAVSTVSFHLKKLEAAQLVTKVKEQYYVIYHLNTALLSLTLSELTSFENPLKIVQEQRIDEYKEKILSTFFTNGKLKKLPTQHKKRLIVLQHILKNFKPDSSYAEKEVDGILRSIYDDYCTIRRYFIDEHMMTRQNGNYSLEPEYATQANTEMKEPAKRSNHKNDRNINAMKEKQNKMVNIKEINRMLKSTPPPMGIYVVKNSVTGNTFLGSSKDLKAIINRHKFELQFNSHRIEELQKSWNEAGETSISFEIIDTLEPKDDKEYDYTSDIEELESLWIEKLQSEGQQLLFLKSTEIKKNKPVKS